jgi:hypothetical protein
MLGQVQLHVASSRSYVWPEFHWLLVPQPSCFRSVGHHSWRCVTHRIQPCLAYHGSLSRQAPWLLIMDMVAGAASVSQLFAYSVSSTRYLQELYTQLKAGDSVYRDGENKISLLLNVIKRLSSHQQIKDSDPIRPVLIDISRLACQLLHLLQPKRILGYNWTALMARDKIDSAFKALDENRKLLHLCVSQASNDTLRTIQTTIEHQRPLSPSRHRVDTMAQRATIVSSHNDVAGFSETGCGWAPETMPNIESNNNKVQEGAFNLAANKNQVANADTLQVYIRNMGQQSCSTHAPTSSPTPRGNQTTHTQTQASSMSSDISTTTSTTTAEDPSNLTALQAARMDKTYDGSMTKTNTEISLGLTEGKNEFER